MAERDRWLERMVEGGRIEHPAGWDDVLDRLADRLDCIWPEWRVSQTKQKLGWLEVYLHGHTGDELAYHVGSAVRTARAEAARTCEQCGHVGDDVRTGVHAQSGWAATLCLCARCSVGEVPE